MKNILKNWLGIEEIERATDSMLWGDNAMYRLLVMQKLHQDIAELRIKLAILESYLKIEQVHDPEKTYYAPVKRK